MANKLVDESSLYLRQHAHNPVDWYPWEAEAFEKAREEDKPIFLSIGYSACHWCHVMERESFEDEDTAELLNEHFVSIKVDREERPDVDQIYMNVVQILTGRGGWPLSVFIDPDGNPIVGGTYFPPEPRYQMPSFKQVLNGVRKAWGERRNDLMKDSQRILEGLKQMEQVSGGEEPDTMLMERIYGVLSTRVDTEHGGFGGAPKFPNPSWLEALLAHHEVTGDDGSLNIVCDALDAMANGGIYDQLGGGFHRYSVDERWLVPHFEKMLYDNAQLVPLYLEVARVTGEKRYEEVARDTLDYLLREMRAPEGGFYSTQDADSEGEEGKFFVWTPEQIADVLGDDAAARFNDVYGVTGNGNFEHGTTVLHKHRDLDEVAQKHQMTKAELDEELRESRARLFEIREQRIKPGRDEKRLASWNGLMLRAIARASARLGEQEYTTAARELGDFLADRMGAQEGSLKRVFDGEKTKIDGFLEDHAYCAIGFLELFRADGAERWLNVARLLTDSVRKHFYDAAKKTFHVTSDEHEQLVTRPVSFYDGATPSAGAWAVEAMLRVGHLTGDQALTEEAGQAIRPFVAAVRKQPRACPSIARSINLSLSPPTTVVVAGTKSQELLAMARSKAGASAEIIDTGSLQDESVVADSLIEGRQAQEARAWVCSGFVCQSPVTSTEELSAQLQVP